MNENKKIKISISIDESIVDHLQEVATDRGTNLSHEVNRYLSTQYIIIEYNQYSYPWASDLMSASVDGLIRLIEKITGKKVKHNEYGGIDLIDADGYSELFGIIACR